MLVCICSRLSEARIAQAITEGARTPLDVFKRCGARRTCSNCTGTIKDMLAQASALAGDNPIR